MEIMCTRKGTAGSNPALAAEDSGAAPRPEAEGAARGVFQHEAGLLGLALATMRAARASWLVP